MKISHDKLKMKVIEIMQKHPNAFPIAEAKLFKGNTGPFGYIGLNQIISKTIKFYHEIPILDVKIIPVLQTTALQEVLLYYFTNTYTEEDEIVRNYKY